MRNARTLDADSVVTIDIPNLLDYYPISEPGTYTVQFDLGLAAHKEFVGRSQTQIDDLERTIRDVEVVPLTVLSYFGRRQRVL